MSNSCSRLHSLFSNNVTNSIKSKLPQIQNPKPTKNPSLFKQAKNKEINNSARDLLDEKDTQKLVEKFKSLSQEKYFRQKHRIYDCVIHRLVLANNSTLIEDTLESQKKYINGEGFASRIIHLYGKAGLFDRARKLFDEMPQRGCEQGVKAFNALLGAAAYSGDFEKVYQLFRELPLKLSIKPSVGCYNMAANALCKLGLLDEAVALLDEMEENGVKASVVSYNILLGALYEKGEFDDAEKIWKNMIKSDVIPSILAYDFKLQRLVNDGKTNEAIELVSELRSKGLKPDTGTYNAMIIGTCKNDDLDGVKRWYNELLNSSCKPNKVTVNTIVPFLLDKEDYGLVYQVCKSMMGKYQCDQSLLQKVVYALAKNSMVEEAKIIVALGNSNRYFPYDLKLPVGTMRFLLW